MLSGSIWQKVYWVILHQGIFEFLKRVWYYLKKHRLKELWLYRSPQKAYRYWVRKESERINHILSSATAINANFWYKPLICIIVPVFSKNTDIALLDKTIKSIEKQAYLKWKLWILVGTSIETNIVDYLSSRSLKDPRINTVILPVSNDVVVNPEIINLLQGDYVCYLGQNDVLAPHALLLAVQSLNARPGIDLIYSDEDYLDRNDIRLNPIFKPDWSPDLILSINYINRFILIQKQLIENICHMVHTDTESPEGIITEYDFVLRLTEMTNKIAHLHHVLYHRRITSGKSNAVPVEKVEEKDSGIIAIRGALERRGIKGDVVQQNNVYSVRYVLRDRPLVSIIIPIRDKVDFLKRCINSIITNSSYDNYEIIIVNNGSIEPNTYNYLKELELLENIIIS